MPTKEAHFRIYRLNQPVGVYGGIVTQSQWVASIDRGFDLADLRGKRAFAGVDLSRNNALTSLALYWPEEEAFHTWSWMPAELVAEQAYNDNRPYPTYIGHGYLETTRGDTIDYRDVAVRMAEVFDAYDIIAVGYDRTYYDSFRQIYENAGIEMPQHWEEIRQGGWWESAAIEQFQHLIIERYLRHRENPIDNIAVAQTTIRMTSGRPQLDKVSKDPRIKNDPIAATIFAVGISMHWKDMSIRHDWEERAAAQKRTAGLWA